MVLPSVNAILNFATKFFEMLTKKQSEHPQTVFQVFHFAFEPQNRPILVQIRTKPTNRYPPTSATKWMRKTPKKAIHPLVYEHDTVCAIDAVFFGEADFFSAKRLFLREARDVSGAHSAPPWARVEIKLKTSFLALSLSSSHARASALTSPPPDFLLSSIPTQATKPHQIKQPLSKIAVNERTVGENCAFSHRVFWISAKNSNFVYHTIHLNLKIDYAQQNDSRRSARH